KSRKVGREFLKKPLFLLSCFFPAFLIGFCKRLGVAARATHPSCRTEETKRGGPQRHTPCERMVTDAPRGRGALSAGQDGHLAGAVVVAELLAHLLHERVVAVALDDPVELRAVVADEARAVGDEIVDEPLRAVLLELVLHVDLGLVGNPYSRLD